MRTICFASSKGGSGKTVISASFAKFLARLGKEVLLVDLDAATNGLSLLFLDEVVEARDTADQQGISLGGIFDSSDGSLPDAFHLEERLSFLPSTYSLKPIEQLPPKVIEATLDAFLFQGSNKYDYVILDAQAGSDEFAKIAISKATRIVIVSEFDPISAEGVERLQRLFPRLMPPDKTVVLVNKILLEFAKSFKDFMTIYRFLSPIPFDVSVIRAFAKRSLPIDEPLPGTHVLAIARAASDLLGREIERDVEQWRKQQEESFRQPVREQLESVSRELRVAERSASEMERRLEMLRTRPRRLLLQGAQATLVLVTVLIALISASSALGVSTITATILTSIGAILVAGGLSIVLYAVLRSERRLVAQQEAIIEQKTELEDRLSYLKDKQARYSGLLDTDIESFLETRSRDT